MAEVSTEYRATVHCRPMRPAAFTDLSSRIPAHFTGSTLIGNGEDPVFATEISGPDAPAVARRLAAVMEQVGIEGRFGELTRADGERWMVARHNGSSTSMHVLDEWIETGEYRMPMISTLDLREFVSARHGVTAKPGQWLLRGPGVGVTAV